MQGMERGNPRSVRKGGGAFRGEGESERKRKRKGFGYEVRKAKGRLSKVANRDLSGNEIFTGAALTAKRLSILSFFCHSRSSVFSVVWSVLSLFCLVVLHTCSHRHLATASPQCHGITIHLVCWTNERIRLLLSCLCNSRGSRNPQS